MAWPEVIGHDGAVSHLRTAAERGRLAHAYLFAGPAGVGKRRFALEFAKSLLCEKPPGPLTPCDRCPGCVQVAAGTHPDFVTVRTPEDRHELPIDAVRAFCQRLGLKPSRGLRNVGLVEDADDLNEESANGFLKTLEEPPPGAVLILLTTALERQLPTILSRCQVVPFRKLGDADLREVLTREGVADPGELGRLTRLAGGSPGVALSLRDPELWAFRSTLLDTLAATRPDSVALARDWQACCEAAGKETASHRERALVTLGFLVELLRGALRLALAEEAGDAAEPGDPESESLGQLTQRMDADDVAAALEACSLAAYHVDRRVQLALVLESLCDKLCRPASA